MSKSHYFAKPKPLISLALRDELFFQPLDAVSYRQIAERLCLRIEAVALDYKFDTSLATDRTYGFLGVVQFVAEQQFKSGTYYSQMLALQSLTYVTAKSAALYRKSKQSDRRLSFATIAQTTYAEFMFALNACYENSLKSPQLFADVQVGTRFYALSQLRGSKFGEDSLRDQFIDWSRKLAKDNFPQFAGTMHELSKVAIPDMRSLIQNIFGDCIINPECLHPVDAMQICVDMVNNKSPFFAEVCAKAFHHLCPEAMKEYDTNPLVKLAIDEMFETANKTEALKPTGRPVQSQYKIDFAEPLRPKFYLFNPASQVEELVH